MRGNISIFYDMRCLIEHLYVWRIIFLLFDLFDIEILRVFLENSILESHLIDFRHGYTFEQL